MAMTDLAIHSQGETVPLAAIAARQQLSLSYLEQLFSKLRRANLVESSRGPGGGYRLSSDARDIFISDIMRAVEEPLRMTRCHLEDTGGCVGDSRCQTHDLWRALGDHIAGFLGSVSLGDVLDNAYAKGLAMSAVQSDKEAPRDAAAG